MRHQIKGEIHPKSAKTSIIVLNDLMSELGIKTPRRYISDDITSWYFEVDLPGVYCVDEVLSMKGKIETHNWGCWDNICVLLECKESNCNDIEVSVMKNDLLNIDPSDNCGNAIRISIPETSGKVLDFDYYGISEVAVIGDPYEGATPTPTSISSLDSLKLETKCEKIGQFRSILNYMIMIAIAKRRQTKAEYETE